MAAISGKRATDERVTYLRIFADANGETHMEDVDIVLKPKQLFKDNPPLRLTDNFEASWTKHCLRQSAEGSMMRRDYLIAELRCASLRARLWQANIDAVGMALKAGLVEPEQALELLRECDCLQLASVERNPSSANVRPARYGRQVVIGPRRECAELVLELVRSPTLFVSAHLQSRGVTPPSLMCLRFPLISAAPRSHHARSSACLSHEPYR